MGHVPRALSLAESYLPGTHLLAPLITRYIRRGILRVVGGTAEEVSAITGCVVVVSDGYVVHVSVCARVWSGGGYGVSTSNELTTVWQHVRARKMY